MPFTYHKHYSLYHSLIESFRYGDSGFCLIKGDFNTQQVCCVSELGDTQLNRTCSYIQGAQSLVVETEM